MAVYRVHDTSEEGAGHAGDGEAVRIGRDAVTGGDERGPTFVLVPGAWCGAGIWDDVAERLRAAGCAVSALTLTGLEQGTQGDPSAVGLQDHVDDVLRHLTEKDLREVVLVGHSYSGLVVGQVTDRAPDRISHAVFVQSFLPADGRSLLGAFGGGAAEEARQIQRDGGWWAPPTQEGLAQEPDLDEEQARALSQRLVPHPGRTVQEPVRMHRSLPDLPATYVLESGTDVPAELGGVPAEHVRYITAGHFSMVTAPDALADLLLSSK